MDSLQVQIYFHVCLPLVLCDASSSPGGGRRTMPSSCFCGRGPWALDGMRSAALDDTISFPGRKRALSTPDFMYIFRFAYVAFFLFLNI